MLNLLDELRVAEIGSSVATAYAGKLFADLGASVVRADDTRPNVGPEAYGDMLWGFLDRGKQAAPASAADLLAGPPDIVIVAKTVGELERDGLDLDALADGGTIVIAITAFGLDETPEPPAVMSDFLAAALGGFVFLTGDSERPPVWNNASLPQFQAAMSGAIGAIAALIRRDIDGQGDVIDVSLYESVAYLFEREDVVYTHQGQSWTRSLRHKVVHPFAVFPCRDGHVAMCVASPQQFISLAELMEAPELGEDQELVMDRLGRADFIDSILLPWLAERDKWTVAELCQERRIPVTPVLRFPELLEDAHLRQREFFQTVDLPGVGPTAAPGMPYRLLAGG